MDEQIDSSIKKERSKIMRELGSEKKKHFYNRFIGKELNTLIETHSRGTTDNYINVKIENGFYNTGEEVMLRIKKTEGEYAVA